MQKQLVICGLLAVLPIISCRSSYGLIFRLDYSYNQEAEGWLKFHRMPLTWDEAVVTCFYEGTVLASPINHGINRALLNMMLQHDVESPMYTGISNTYSPSVYQSMEGVPISNIHLTWSSEPQRPDTENCIVLNLNGTATECSCTDRRPFACYKKEGIKTTPCNTLDEEYVMNNQTGSCYKLYREKHTWPEAHRICTAEGGHLAIVNSQVEAEYIWQLGIDSGSNYALALGFHEWGHDRTIWITTQGQSIKDAGYDKWYTGEPNIVTENCGAFMFDGNPKHVGILADLPCDVKVMFICEIDP